MSHASVLVALDPANVARLGGIEPAVAEQMKPFDEGGTWFADGSRWDWYQVGGRFAGRLLGRDTALRSELTEEALAEETKQRYRGWYREGALETEKHGRSLLSNALEGETEDEYVARKGCAFFAFAFLRNKRWHEKGRLGFFGKMAHTECEVKSLETTGEEYTGRCTSKSADGTAQIVSFQEAKGDDDGADDKWVRLFWARFMRNLPPETVLVMVDYHI